MALPTKLLLDIVTPRGNILSSQVDSVSATGVKGEFCVLPGHLPLLSGLKTGPFSFKRQGKPHEFVAGDGFAEVGPDHVVIMVDVFSRGEILALTSLIEWNTWQASDDESVKKVKVDALRNAITRSEAKIRQLENEENESSEEYQTLQALLVRARARLDQR